MKVAKIACREEFSAFLNSVKCEMKYPAQHVCKVCAFSVKHPCCIFTYRCLNFEIYQQAPTVLCRRRGYLDQQSTDISKFVCDVVLLLHNYTLLTLRSLGNFCLKLLKIVCKGFLLSECFLFPCCCILR